MLGSALDIGYCMLLLLLSVVLLVLLLFANAAAGTSPYPISIYIHTFARVFPFDFIYMVNEEREKQTEGMDGCYQIHLIYVCLFSCMLNECCTTNDDGELNECGGGLWGKRLLSASSASAATPAPD